jgi:hypothetical protein
MKRGIAHLPLHYGKAPAWLFSRMKKLAKEITLVIVHESGTDGFLEKISDPFWFQAFGCVLGFDWHSSGLTTTSLGALKEGLKDVSKEIGLYVCGGKGATSRKTPLEIDAIASESTKEIPVQKLIYASRMSAKVDSSALQDGYQLYHHCFLFNQEGNWTVVQQGMNDTNRMARRYHWLGKKALNFVCDPHSAVCCNRRSKVLNMTAAASEGCRDASTSLAREEPGKVVNEYERIRRLELSSRHPVSVHDIRSENLRRILEKTYEKKPANFEALLGSEGVGPKTIRALSLISELIYGKPSSFEDPVRFSFAHGGKDGHPYPVNKEEYDRSIDILREAVNLSRIGRTDKMKALKRLNENF